VDTQVAAHRGQQDQLIYLGLEQISRKWTMPIRNWKAALQQFAILYEDRLPLEAIGVAKT